MQNVKYDYSSVHLCLPKELSDEIIAYGVGQIKDDEIYVSQRDPTFGREDEIHLTALYGIHSDDFEPIRALLEGSGKVKAKFGKLDIFTDPFRFDVVVIKVVSTDLAAINHKLESSVKFTNKYKEFKPHVTIAYIKKGKGWKHIGLDWWEGEEFTCDTAVFSNKQGVKYKISL